MLPYHTLTIQIRRMWDCKKEIEPEAYLPGRPAPFVNQAPMTASGPPQYLPTPVGGAALSSAPRISMQPPPPRPAVVHVCHSHAILSEYSSEMTIYIYVCVYMCIHLFLIYIDNIYIYYIHTLCAYQ